VAVELETPVLLYWLKVSEVEEWGEREGGHGKEGGFTLHGIYLMNTNSTMNIYF